jgi:type IV secretion system protein VirD4
MGLGLLALIGFVGWFLHQHAVAQKQRNEAAKNATAYKPDRTFTSSEWASEEDLRKAGCFTKNGFPAGFCDSGKQIFFPGKRKPNGIVFGSTGSGKSTSCLLNVILSWAFSLVCFDLFGELAVVAAKARSRYGPVQIVAPYPVFQDELSQFPNVGFNPLSPRSIDPNDRNMVGIRCAKLASAIVLKDDHAAEKYWANTSRQLVTVVIMCVVLYFPERLRNLATVAAIIMDDVFDFARRMMVISDDPYIRAKLSRFAVKLGDSDVKSLLEVVESARTEVEFLTEPAVADCFSRDDLNLDDVMHGKMSVFVMQPQELVKEMTRFRRVFLTWFLGRYQREDAAYANPALVLIDELLTIGFLDDLDLALTTVRKLNLRFYLSIPSVGALAQLYPQTFKVILDSCGLKQWCDVNVDDSEFLSNLCGEREIVRRTKSVNWSPLYNYEKPSNLDLQNLHVSNNTTTERVPLIRPHELRDNLGPDGIVMFMAEVSKPILAKRRPYFKIPGLRRKSRPNPYFTRKRPAGQIAALKGNDDWKKLLTE